MQSGDRVLTEAEWALFAEGLDLLRSDVEDELGGDAEPDDLATGVSVFDALTAEQRLALLADVALALRDPDVPTPPHTAANEGAIAAVIRRLREAVEGEIDLSSMEGERQWTTVRELLRAVAAEGEDPPRKLPSPTRESMEVWQNILEEFEGRILWDTDYAMGDEFLDMPPAVARAAMASLTIDPDYYLANPPDPDEAGLTPARQTLARLLGRPVPDDDGMYSALHDNYHGIGVGPLTEAECNGWLEHPWVDPIGTFAPGEGCDCDYATWCREFRGAIPSEPYTPQPYSPSDGDPGPLPEGLRTEQRGDAWVVREGNSYWCNLVDGGWTDNPDEQDECMPLLTFGSEVEARAAYLRANAMYAERKARREAALTRLGIEE